VVASTINDELVLSQELQRDIGLPRLAGMRECEVQLAFAQRRQQRVVVEHRDVHDSFRHGAQQGAARFWQERFRVRGAGADAQLTGSSLREIRDLASEIVASETQLFDVR
jgi:hypothetical protein